MSQKFPESIQPGHLGVRSPTQFALMNPATFAAQKVLVDDGVQLSEYYSNGNVWLAAPGFQPFGNGYALVDPAGGVLSLSNTVPEVLANPTATTTVLTGAGLYYGYRCTTATGNITVYDSLTASGKILVPTTALALGSFPIFGAGNPNALQVTLGVTVALSGAGVVFAGVEAG